MTKLKALIILALVVLAMYGLALYKSANMIEDIKATMPTHRLWERDLRSLTEK